MRLRHHGLWRMWLRAMTFLGGLTIGLAALLALTLVSRNVTTYPPPRLEVEAERLGPMTAVQPALRQALVTEEDLAPATGQRDRSGAGQPSPAAGVTGPPGAPPGGAEESLLGPPECRGLFGDPPALAQLWPPSLAPEEVTSRDTPRPGGSVLRQVLTLFEEALAPQAFTHLRDTAEGCEEFTMWWEGQVVTVELEDLRIGALWPRLNEVLPVPPPPRDPGPDHDQHPNQEGPAPDRPGPEPPGQPPEAGTDLPRQPAARPHHPGSGPFPDQTHALSVTIHRPIGGPLVGWLAVDRMGPVVSLLHHLGPVDGTAGGPVETRRVALSKLRPLVRMLDR